MSRPPTAPVAAVVLGAGGGARLARTLESVAWASERIVLDPANRLGTVSLPAGVRRTVAADPTAATAAAWVLLVAEGEEVSAALQSAIGAALGPPPPTTSAWRIGLDVGVPGGTLRSGRAAVRLAARGARLRVRRDGGVELVPGAGAVRRLAPPLGVAWAGDLATAVADLEADAATLAALLRADARRPTVRGLVAGALTAAATAFVARALHARLAARWRWAAAVLAGYRIVVAQAKLWETTRRLPGAAA